MVFGSVFVKTDDGEILGRLLGAIWAKRLYVSILAVQEPFRSKGYGTDFNEPRGTVRDRARM